MVELVGDEACLREWGGCRFGGVVVLRCWYVTGGVEAEGMSKVGSEILRFWKLSI